MKTLITNTQKCDALINAINGMNYGDVIPHSDIGKVIDEIPNTPKYYSIIKKVNKTLLVAGKVIKSVRATGYEVIKPSDYTRESITKFKQGARCIQKGENLLTYAPTKHMNGEELKVHRNVSDRARILHASIQGACVELNLLGKKNHPMLPENIKK